MPKIHAPTGFGGERYTTWQHPYFSYAILSERFSHF